MDVVVVGSIVMDLMNYVEKFPSIGETVFGYEFKKGFGGKGANQCVMAKLLGAKSTIVGKVGDDVFGKDYIQRFNDLSINTDFIEISSSSSTGTAGIIVRKHDGANQIVISPGANFCLTVEDIKKASKVITESKVVLCQLEIPLEPIYYALKLAKKHNVFTIMNPAPIPDSGLDLSTFPTVDIFCPNESEASVLTNIKIKTIEDAQEAIKYFFINYPNQIHYPMITLGRLGVVYGNINDREIHHVPAPTVDAVDSTGAGDCFAGSLGYYFAMYPNLSFNEKVKRSVYLASKSVQKFGTQSSFPNSSDALELFE